MPPQQSTILTPSSTSETQCLVGCINENSDFCQDVTSMQATTPALHPAAASSRSSGIRKPTPSQLEPLDVSFVSEARKLAASPLLSARSNPTTNKRHSSSSSSSSKKARSLSEQELSESDSPTACRLPCTSNFQATSSLGTASSVLGHHDTSSSTEPRNASVSSSLCGPDHCTMQQRSRKRKDNRKGYSCANCGTSNTPLWRKGNNGQDLCNKCGLYWSRHGAHRPLHQCESSPISSTPHSAVSSSSFSSSSSSSSALSSRAPSPAVQFDTDSPELPDSTLINTPIAAAAAAAAAALSSEEDAASSLADEDDIFDLDYTPSSAKRTRRSSASHLMTTPTSAPTTASMIPTPTASSTPTTLSRSNRKGSPSSTSKRQPARRNLMKSLPAESEQRDSCDNILKEEPDSAGAATIHHPDLSNVFTGGESYSPLPIKKRSSESKRRSQQKRQKHLPQSSSPDTVECAQHAIQFLQMQQQNRSQPALIPQNYVHDRAYGRDWAIVQERTEDLAAGKGISVDYQTLHSIFGTFHPAPPMPHLTSSPMPVRPQPFAPLPSFHNDPSLVIRFAQLQQQQQQILQQLLHPQQQAINVPTTLPSQIPPPLPPPQPSRPVNRFSLLNSFTTSPATTTPVAPLSFNLDAENVNYDDILYPSSPDTSQFLKFPEAFPLELNHSPTHQTSPIFDYISPPPPPPNDPFETLSQLSDASPTTPSAYLLCER